MANDKGKGKGKADTAEVAVAATVYTYRRTHPGGGSLGRTAYAVVGSKGIVIIDTALLPKAYRDTVGQTITFTPVTAEVPGYTLRYKAYMVGCNRHTYHVPGVPGVVTFHATQMPAGSMVDSVPAPMLACSVPLRQPGVPAHVASTTSAVNAAANLAAAESGNGVIAAPAEVAAAAADAMPGALKQ